METTPKTPAHSARRWLGLCLILLLVAVCCVVGKSRNVETYSPGNTLSHLSDEENSSIAGRVKRLKDIANDLNARLVGDIQTHQRVEKDDVDDLCLHVADIARELQAIQIEVVILREEVAAIQSPPCQ